MISFMVTCSDFFRSTDITVTRSSAPEFFLSLQAVRMNRLIANRQIKFLIFKDIKRLFANIGK